MVRRVAAVALLVLSTTTPPALHADPPARALRLAQAPLPATCQPVALDLNEPFVVLAAGAYAGRTLEYQIDQSGHEATRIDVDVNHGAKPVVLMLGAYEPTVWNIRWSRNTYIAYVVVGGYHRQVVAGLPRSVPILTTTYDNKGPCGYFYISPDRNEALNPLARRLFGQPVAMVHPATGGRVHIGDPVRESELLTSGDSSPDGFRDPTAPPAGRAGIAMALRNGQLRAATPEDVAKWRAAEAAALPRDEPPVAGSGARGGSPITHHETYVVLREFVYPAGLYGGNSVSFIIPKGVAAPSGNPGHSRIYDHAELERRAEYERREARRRERQELGSLDFAALPAATLEKRLEASHPVGYYQYAMHLFRSGRQDEAVFWFYVGQLRYRFLLLVTGGAGSDTDGAVFASLSATIGQEINAYAARDPRSWAAQMQRALDWDSRHPNGATSQRENAVKWRETRAGMQKLRAHVLANAASIKAQQGGARLPSQ